MLRELEGEGISRGKATWMSPEFWKNSVIGSLWEAKEHVDRWWGENV